MKNVVNTECGHMCCKDCFWRWTKGKNTCPYCRTNLLATTKELEEQKQMRELLDHRSEIIRQVEEEYEHHDRITKKIKKSILQRIKLDQKIKELKISKNDALAIKKGTYNAMRHFKKKLAHAQADDRVDWLRKVQPWTERVRLQAKLNNIFQTREPKRKKRKLMSGKAQLEFDPVEYLKETHRQKVRSRRRRRREILEQEYGNYCLDALFQEEAEIPPERPPQAAGGRSARQSPPIMRSRSHRVSPNSAISLTEAQDQYINIAIDPHDRILRTFSQIVTNIENNIGQRSSFHPYLFPLLE